MSLLDVLRSGVSIANSVTKPIQATISFRRCTGTDGEGAESYAAAVTFTAALEQKMRSVLSPNGEQVVSSATLTIVDIAALLVATPAVAGPSGEILSALGEIVTRDLITLPNGRTQPIVATGGFIDAGTGSPVATEVYLQ